MLPSFDHTQRGEDNGLPMDWPTQSRENLLWERQRHGLHTYSSVLQHTLHVLLPKSPRNTAENHENLIRLYCSNSWQAHTHTHTHTHTNTHTHNTHTHAHTHNLFSMHPSLLTQTYSLQFRAGGKVFPWDDQQSGQVDACVLVRLHFKALAIPASQQKVTMSLATKQSIEQTHPMTFANQSTFSQSQLAGLASYSIIKFGTETGCTVPQFCFLFHSTSFIPCGKFWLSYLDKATAATRAAPPIPNSACDIFVCWNKGVAANAWKLEHAHQC